MNIEEDYDEIESLLLQEELERVSPKMEAFREPCRIKLAKGGRGAGAKSWSAGSLLIQAANYRKLRIGCFREVQKSIQESSQELLIGTIARLGYENWHVTKGALVSPVGSRIIFRGLNDMRAAGQVKGLEGFDIFFLEEAARISEDSMSMILPTLRKKGSELWAVYNQETEHDPIEKLWKSTRKDVLRVWLEPGRIDNPWWTDELENEMLAAFEDDPDEAEHIWHGFPRKQSKNSVVSRVSLSEAKDRPVEDEDGAVEIGCDVARFGADSTIAFKRKGFRIIDRKEVKGADTTAVSAMLWNMADMNPTIPIKVDSGYNPGVIDVLTSFGAFVVAVGFGERALQEDKYPNAASEMMFELPMKKLSLPAEYMTKTLIEDLTERLYSYDTQGRKKIEPKDGTSVVEGSSKGNFKARHGGRSPDEGDALCLAFYSRVPNWEML
jgi:phage terminase large subunit